LNLSTCVLTKNSADAEGGAIDVQFAYGILTASDCLFVGNASTGIPAFHVGSGGAIAQSASSSVAVTDSVVSGNFASNSGGGLYVYFDGGLNVTTSTISGNTAAGFGGGGIYFYGTPTTANFTVTNSTISGNKATSIEPGKGVGGGIALRNFGGSLTVQNSTITLNEAAMSSGGGIARAKAVGPTSGVGFVALESSIVANNKTPVTPDATADLLFDSASDLPADNSLIGITDAANKASLIGAGNLVGTIFAPVDPFLMPLADNGGPAPTHALLPFSPAFDKGNNKAALSGDERGYARIVGAAADIGAFEAQPLGAKVTGVVINGGAVQRSRVM